MGSPFLTPGAAVHLIGICGTGMASLAGLLQESGYRVTGSDSNVYPPMSTFLEELGIPVQQGYAAENLEPPPDLVVVGNALSRGNVEIEVMLDRALRYESMARVLKELFLRGRESLVVAGTHGKTTTSSLLAWILDAAGLAPGFLIGGIAENFASGFRTPHGPGGWFVIEGDEYDTAYFDKGPKFLHYLPQAMILTSIEYDHADIYADLDSIKTAFRRLVNLAPGRGLIVAHGESASVEECVSRAFCPVERYGFAGSCFWRAQNVEHSGEWTRFEIYRGGERFLKAEMPLPGRHNVLNALAATALAARYEVSAEVICRALRSFRGIKRRMELRGEVAGVAVMDDFAHHPTAIRETLRAVRLRFPGRRIWALLEPRSNTLRRRVFEKELSASFDGADQVIIAGVYRSGNIPEAERLVPECVVENLVRRGLSARYFPSAQAIVEAIAPEVRSGDVIVVMSNGGFEGIHEKLLAALAHA